MKVGLYLQTDSGGIGGACFWTACLASYLAARHQVTIFHHKPGLRLSDLAEFSGQDLSSVGFETLPVGHCGAWHRRDGGPDVTDISRKFDLFVTITHLIPPQCASALGVLIVLFPLEPRAAVWPWNEAGSRLSPRRILREWKHGRRWNEVFGSYRVRTSLSTFCQDWARRLWQTSTDVLYPPSAMTPAATDRDPRIVSIGRFTVEGVSKHQVELARMFRTAIAPQAPGWRYASMGTRDDRAETLRYCEAVLAAAENAPIDVMVNVPRPRLRDLVSRAKVFWHAAGLTVDEGTQPQLCEHFGHVTVEAMSAGCVPVIIGKGGQREIVRHGTDGFVCDSIEEMAQRTRQLIEDETLWTTMSASARERARDFSIDSSMGRLSELVLAASGVRL